MLTNTRLVPQVSWVPGLRPDVKDPLTVVNLKDAVSGHGKPSGNSQGREAVIP